MIENEFIKIKHFLEEFTMMSISSYGNKNKYQKIFSVRSSLGESPRMGNPQKSSEI